MKYLIKFTVGFLFFFTGCNSSESVQLTKEERSAAHNEVLNRTPKLLDSLDKDCAKNFVTNRQHFIDSLVLVRQQMMQAKVSTNPIQ